MVVCPSCLQTDHARSSSSRCLNRKRRIRERDLDKNEKIEIYTIKKCLSSIICPLMKNKSQLLQKIQQDVREVSRLSIEMSVLVNYFYKSYFLQSAAVSTREDFYKLFPKFSPLHFMYILQNKRNQLNDPADVIGTYKRMRSVAAYIGYCRTYIIQEVAKQYDTVFKTNITTHMFSRVKRYLRLLYPDQSPAEIHRKSYQSYYQQQQQQQPLNDVIGQFFTQYELNVKNVEKNPWMYVYLLMEMQRKFETTIENEEKNIQTFPQYSHGSKYITYTSTGLYELLRSIKEPDVPGDHVRFREEAPKYWHRYFNVAKNFGYALSTDGVACSLSMNRIVLQKTSSIKKRKIITDDAAAVLVPSKITRILAVDPGAKTPIVTCDTTLQYQMLRKEQVAHETREYMRKRKRMKWTGKLDEKLHAKQERVGFDKTSSRSIRHVHQYTEFFLQHFQEKQQCYERRNLQRLKFDKYVHQQKLQHLLIRKYFYNVNEQTLVLYGKGYDFMNKSSFRGHRKFSHSKLLSCLRKNYSKNVTCLDVDESYTTKTCSYCRRTSNVEVNVQVAKKDGHRYVFCSKCHKGLHRDKNGAQNILVKFIQKNIVNLLSWIDNDSMSLKARIVTLGGQI
nr:hypothetical protein [Microctonus hyperodae filamentous virus]